MKAVRLLEYGAVGVQRSTEADDCTRRDPGEDQEYRRNHQKLVLDALGLAILWPKKLEYHRRLILIAPCALTAAAWDPIYS